MLNSVEVDVISAFGAGMGQGESAVSLVQVEILAEKVARMENVVDRMAVSLGDAVQASIDIRASTFVKTEDLRFEIDRIRNEVDNAPAWVNLQSMLSKQSDEMLTKLTSANE
eukprot:7898592-Karenia_brevis.AAC.1